jgi:hypothetical protein
MNLIPFESWADVLAYARAGGSLYYQAPLDREPTRFWSGHGREHNYEASKRTIRMWPPGSIGRGRARTSDPFTADAGHLSRFSHPIENELPGRSETYRGTEERRRVRAYDEDEEEEFDGEEKEEFDLETELESGLVIGDTRRGYSVSFDGKHIGDFNDFDDALAAGVQKMHDSKYFPNVFHVNERGNTDQLTVKFKVRRGKVTNIEYNIVRGWV